MVRRPYRLHRRCRQHPGRLVATMTSRKFAVSLAVCALLLADAHGQNSALETLNPYAPYTQEMVAKAFVSAAFGRPARIMRTFRADENGYVIDYTRPSDGSEWRTHVVPGELPGSGSRIRWRSWDTLLTPQKWGRWRDHPLDSVFEWYIDGNGVLLIRELVGNEIITKHFTMDDFE